MEIPISIMHYVKPGTEAFIVSRSKSVDEVFRLVSEDRLRNLVLAGDTKTAQSVGTDILNAAKTDGFKASESFVMGLMNTLGLTVM